MAKPISKKIVFQGLFVLFLAVLVVGITIVYQSMQQRLDREVAIEYFRTRLGDGFSSHLRDLQSEKTDIRRMRSALFYFAEDELFVTIRVTGSFDVLADDIKFAKKFGKIDQVFVDDESADMNPRLVEFLTHLQARFVLISGPKYNRLDLSWMKGCKHPLVLNISDVRSFQNLESRVVEKLYLTEVNYCVDAVLAAIDSCPNLKEIAWRNCGDMTEAHGAMSQRHPEIMFREFK